MHRPAPDILADSHPGSSGVTNDRFTLDGVDAQAYPLIAFGVLRHYDLLPSRQRLRRIRSLSSPIPCAIVSSNQATRNMSTTSTAVIQNAVQNISNPPSLGARWRSPRSHHSRTQRASIGRGFAEDTAATVTVEFNPPARGSDYVGRSILSQAPRAWIHAHVTIPFTRLCHLNPPSRRSLALVGARRQARSHSRPTVRRSMGLAAH